MFKQVNTIFEKIMKKIFLFLLSAVCAALPRTLNAQNNTVTFDTYMKGQADLYRFNGNVLIAKNGKVIYKKSFGFADYNTQNKLDNNSIFDCGSIAKEFTAMGILLLKDKGKISYTDTLGKFFPELPYSNITIHQLLTHTSGMPDGFNLVTKSFNHSKVAFNSDLIKLMADEKPPLLFIPGADLMYSGTAFNLLASVIEKVSGQSYNAYMDIQVFGPLRMKHTSVVNGPRSLKKIPGLAVGFVYSDSLKKFIPADSLHTGWTTYLAGITGEGMILTTTEDLLKWDRSLKNNSLLAKATQQAMLSVQGRKKTFPFVSFGYGIRVEKNETGNYVFHNGYFPGYKSMHLRYTDEDITVIVLSNNESQSEFIADALSAIALNKNMLLPYEHKETIINTNLEDYAGKYRMPLTRPPYMVSFPVELVLKNRRLYIHTGSREDIELKAEQEMKFFYADGTDQQIEFEKDNSGHLSKVWHIAWGVKKEIKREK